MEAALRTQLHEGVAKGLKAARRWGWGLEHLGRGGRKWKSLEQKLWGLLLRCQVLEMSFNI